MRKLKITSLILVVVMLLGMLPMGIFSISAAPAAPLTLPTTDGGTLSSYYTQDFSLDTAPKITETKADVTEALNGAWRDAEGILLQIDAEQAANFFPQILMLKGSYGASSWMRITTAQNIQGCNPAHVGAMKSTIHIYDGSSWTTQKTDNIGGADYISLDAGFSGYVYIPFDQLYWQGNGNSLNVSNYVTPFYGASAEEFLLRYESSALDKLKIWTDGTTSMTLGSFKVVYKDHASAPTNDLVAEDFAWTEATAKVDDGAKTPTVTDTRTAMTAGKSVTYLHSKVGARNGTGVFLGASTFVDVSGAKGFSFKVDASADPDNQLNLRPWMQCAESVQSTIYNKGYWVKNNSCFDKSGTALTPFYVDFTGQSGSYMQFVCDTPNSYAFIRAEGASEWTKIYPTGSPAALNTEGQYVLPAGFKGEVYIPASSYWLTMHNNGSPMMVPFADSAITHIKFFGFFNSWVNAVDGTTNKVTLSDLKIYRQAEVEIGTADELITFFNNLDDYAGKTVVLTDDIILNEGWLASSGTEPAVKLSTRTADNNYFAGIFDGKGHVISGLYLKESDSIKNVGLFGNVKTKTQATVKNVSILNTYVKQTNTTATGAHTNVEPYNCVGGIFGQVMSDLTGASDFIGDPNYVNKTKATIDRVYADITVVAGNGHSGASGAGGFVGILQSDLDVRASTFAGSVTSGMRGVAAFVGTIQVPQRAFDNDNNPDTANVSGNCSEVNLYLESSVFTGSLTNEGQGFTGGVIGYSNVNCANIEIHNLIITGSINSSKNYKGWLQGGSWTGRQNVRLGADEYTDWTIYNVTVVDDENDDTTLPFGKGVDSMRIYLNDGNIDWNNDGAGSWGESKVIVFANNNTGDDRNANGVLDAQEVCTIATAEQLPSVLLSASYQNVRYTMTLDEDLTPVIKIPVGSFTLAPGVDVATVIKPQRSGANAGSVALSEDGAFWVASFPDLLPQDINKYNYRITFNGNANAGATVTAMKLNMTISSMASSVAIIPSDYLKTLINDANSTVEVKDLATDLLKYASATQNFRGLTAIDTSALDAGYGYAAEDIVGEYDDPTNRTLRVTKDDHSFVQLAFRCDSKLALQINVSAAGTYTATLNGKAVEVDNSKAADGYILIYLNPLDWNAKLQVTDPNTAAVLYYTLTDYFAWVLEEDNGIAQRQKDVVTALFNYMMSAQAYVDSIAE